jgi:hypothetical protein
MKLIATGMALVTSAVGVSLLRHEMGKVKEASPGSGTSAAIHALPKTIDPNRPAIPVDPSAAEIGRSMLFHDQIDIDGSPIALPMPGARFTVVAMVGTTCPLSRKSGPTLAALEKAYSARGVRFVFVDPSPDETPDELRKWKSELGWSGPVVHDPGHRWVSRLGAVTTTEMWVLDPEGTVRYRGAVDDQYAVGASLPKPRQRFLASALDALLSGKDPETAATNAPGCLLPTPIRVASPAPTYHGAVSPIVAKHCVPCHRKDGVAPFSLESPESVRARSAMIAAVVEKGIMPPWFATREGGPWKRDPTLHSDDKAALLAWAKGTRAIGIAREKPRPVVSPNGSVGKWAQGKPDLVIEMPKAVSIPASGTMPYVNIDVPSDLLEDKWVQSVEVHPGDKAVVHHVTVTVMPGAGRAKISQVGFLAEYSPGSTGHRYRDGVAKLLPAGAILRFQMHYTPNGKATTDRTRLGLKFATGPVRHQVFTHVLMNREFVIPPGARNHRVETRETFREDALLLSFLPHAHLRGKSALFELVHGNGEAENLLQVPRYDFNWQLSYELANLKPVKAGDSIVYAAWYDNSGANASNPDPSRTVRHGEQTADEMHTGVVEYLVPGRKPGDPKPAPLGDPNSRRRLRGTKAEDRPARVKPFPKAIARIFANSDKNRDGTLTKAEVAQGWKHVAPVDANHDNQVDSAEVDRWMKTHFPGEKLEP